MEPHTYCVAHKLYGGLVELSSMTSSIGFIVLHSCIFLLHRLVGGKYFDVTLPTPLRSMGERRHPFQWGSGCVLTIKYMKIEEKGEAWRPPEEQKKKKREDDNSVLTSPRT